MPRPLLIALCAAALSGPALADDASGPEPAATGAHAFTFDGFTGDPVAMADFAGQPVLVVNTASMCGFTGQYDGLQDLYEAHMDDGLVVLGVPSASFNQEYATEQEVKDECLVNFSITFPMTAITPVTGDESHPFYTWVRDELGRDDFPKWNFNKVLIGADGALAGSYAHRVRPMSRKIRGDVAAALDAAGENAL